MKQILTKLGLFEEVLAGLSLFILTFLMITDVLSREVLGESLPWAQKQAVFSMIWCGFLGTCVVSARSFHLRPEVATKLWPKRCLEWVESAENLVTFLFSLLFGIVSLQYVQTTAEMGDVNVVTRVPVWINQLVIPYVFFSLAFRHFLYVFFPSLKPVRKIEDSR